MKKIREKRKLVLINESGLVRMAALLADIVT